MLTRAAKGLGSAAMSFAKSPAGMHTISQGLQGYAQGKMLEDQLKHGDYFDRKWADPRQKMILDAAASRRPAVPTGYLDRARRYSQLAESRYQPTVSPGGGDRRGYATGVGGG